MLTLTDLFAGAGGSTTGAVSVPGVRAAVAANHWQLAIDSHSANHPDTEHVCADISQYEPRLFPTTDVLWASPSCTHHSSAQGKKRRDLDQPDMFGDILPDEAAERSRATMWDVVRFSERHQYRAVIVENVVEVCKWLPFRAWLSAMESIGYCHRIVYLNAMHAQVFGPGAPQSRDRVYIVFWRTGNPEPEIDRILSPRAACPVHGEVDAQQVFKPGSAVTARYRAQYNFLCPVAKCHQVVEPSYRPAADAIDWSLEGERIGDRELREFKNRKTGEVFVGPLAAKTLARIQAGMDRYWRPVLVPVEGRDGKQAAPVDQPARTLTTRNETGLAFIAELRGGGSDARPVTQPLATVTAAGNHHGLVTTYYGNGSTNTTDDALSTVTTRDRHALLMRNNTPRGDAGQMVTPAAEAMRTLTTTGHQSLLTGLTVDINDVLFRMLEPHEIAAGQDFPRGYVIKGNKREMVRQIGGAVCPPAARDLVGIVAESLGVVA